MAIGLACLTAVGWIYTHELMLYSSFKGASGGGHDFGLITIISAWFWATVWAAGVMLFLAKYFWKFRSWAGFLAITFGSIFAGDRIAVRMIRFDDIDAVTPYTAMLKRIFFIVGMGGMLPEGRHPWAGFDTCYFLGVLMLALGGVFTSLINASIPFYSNIILNLRLVRFVGGRASKIIDSIKSQFLFFEEPR